jgi:DNA-binding transcriptional ArsR family regulator
LRCLWEHVVGSRGEATTSRHEIAKPVRDFIARFIDSVELLEVLLLLRAAPDKVWTPEEVARALTSTPDSVTLRLDELERRNLVRADQAGEKSFRYSPANDETNRRVDEVAEAYARRRTTVIGLIFSGPSEGVRGFSDAFRLRED